MDLDCQFKCYFNSMYCFKTYLQKVFCVWIGFRWKVFHFYPFVCGCCLMPTLVCFLLLLNATAITTSWSWFGI